MAYDEIESKWLQIHGISCHIRVVITPQTKHKTPIILAHGLSVSSRYMIPTIHSLTPYFPVYAPDLPGFGKSNKLSRVLSVPELADSLAECIKALGLKKIILLGNSLGCQIIVAFVLKYPQYATHIILVGPTTEPKGRSLRVELKRILVDMTKEPLSYLPVIIKEYSDAGIRRTVRTILYGFNYKLEEKISKINLPTLIIRGDRDPIVPQEWVEQLHELFPNSQLKIIKNAAHAVNFNSPYELVKVVQRFLQETT